MAEITQSTGRRSIRMDMTPMVDLAFLLLTFFMLTTTWNDPYVMEVLMPEKVKGKQPEVNQKHVVTLILGGNDKIFWSAGIGAVVQQTDYSAAGIRQVLLQLGGSIKDVSVFIKPTDESRYQNLVDILDEMMISGVQRYYLVDATSADLKLIKSR